MRDLFSRLSFTGWDAVLALAVVLAAWIAARLCRRAADRVLNRVRVPADLRELTTRLVGYIILFLGVGIALSFLGASIQPVLAVAVLIGVFAALALRGIADNVAAGIVIQTRRPVRLTETIEVLGFVGTVRDLSSRSVVIETADGRLVHLPNGKVLDNPLVNLSGTGRRASPVEVRIRGSHDSDVVAVVTDVVSQVPGVHDDPTPGVVVNVVEPDQMTLTVTCWHAPASGSTVITEVVMAIARHFEEVGLDVVVSAPPAPAGPAAVADV